MSLLGGGQQPGAPPVMRTPAPTVHRPTFGGGSPTGGGTSQRPWWQDLLYGAGGAALATGLSYGLGQIPGLGGQVVQGPQMPSDITGLRNDVISWLRGQGGTPNLGGVQPAGGVTQQGQVGGGPIFSGGSATPTYTASGAMTGPISGVPESRVSADVSGTGAPMGAQTNYGGPQAANPQSSTTGPTSPYSQIFSNYVGAFNPALTNATQVGAVPQLSPVTVGPAGQSNYTAAQAGPAVGAGGYLDPRFSQIFNSIPGFGSDAGFMPAVGGVVKPVADIGSVSGMVQNIADVVNSPATSGYFRDVVLKPYSDLFSQQRGQALAQARESSGNLTGSGYANILGNTVNQLVPQEQAQLADILTSLAQSEVGRQQTVAQREQERNIQNQNTGLTTSVENARNATSASVANAGASSSLAGSRLGAQGQLLNTFANIFGDQAAAQALAQNNTNQFNVNQTNQVSTQQAIANANNATQVALAQGQISAQQASEYFQAQVRREIENANLNQNTNQFNAGQYNSAGMFNNQTQQGVNNQNAQAFLNLLMGLSTGGVTAGSQAYQPGAADAFAQVPAYFLQYFGNRTGSTTQDAPTNYALNYSPTQFAWQGYGNG